MGLMRPERIPLFPLNVVLLPGADLPLHIFEPRYRQMVSRCLEDKSEFGMLLAVPKGIVQVGCTAEITQLVKRYEDGRMDILTAGRSPFRVVELFTVEGSDPDDNPLLEGDVDYLDDRDGRTDPQIRQELVDLYETCYTIVFGDYPRNVRCDAPTDEPECLSYCVAANLPLDLLWKQQILELRTESDRQERLVRYLRQLAPHLQKSEALRQHAGGNGRSIN
jgi:ATP-dependent Lon protease